MTRDTSGLTGPRKAPNTTRSTAGLSGRRKQDPEPDPLAGVEYTDNLEQDAAAELTALNQSYRDRAAQETKRYEYAVDGEFWAGIVFHTREDRERFLKAVGMDNRVYRGRYLDGYELADRLNLDMN